MRKSTIFLANWKLLFSIIVLLTSIFVFLSLDDTLGWFSNNTNVNANGMSIQAASSEIQVKSCDYYIYDEDLNVGKKITDNIYIPQYDTVFTDLNENAILIAKITVSGSAAFQDATTLNLKFSCSGSYYENDIVAKYLSNVVEIKAAVIDSIREDAFDDTIYTSAKEYFANNSSNSTTFFDESNSNYYKKANNTTSLTIKKEANASSVTVYLLLGYSDALIQNANLDPDADMLNQTVDLIGDLTSLEFSI